MPETLPFNRLESSNWDLLAALPRAGDDHVFAKLRDAFREVTGCADVIFAPSCRSAIAQILMLLPHQEVLLPAYTCPVVKTAVELAGKRIIWVEIPKDSLNASAAHFAEKIRTGAVLIPTHVFGIPAEIEKICALARQHGCITLEDVAGGFGLRHGFDPQRGFGSLGLASQYQGRWLGGFGDFGVYSFERTKRLPAFRGAAILINNPNLVDPAKLASLRLVSTTNAFSWRDFAFSLAHNIGTHPRLYPKLVSARKLRKAAKKHLVVQSKTPNVPLNTPFYTREFHAYQAALLLRMLPRMDAIREHIAKLVSVYRDVLQNSPIRMLLKHSEFDLGGMLRFPVAFPGKDRAQIVRMARERGIPLEAIFDEILPEPSERVHFPNAIWATENVAILPLYPGLSPAAAHRIASQVIQIHREAPDVKTAVDMQPRFGPVSETSRSASLAG